MLAATVRVTDDIDLAEECVQDAYARALVNWTTNGVPTRPGAWLTTVARRRAIDLLRSMSARDRSLALLASVSDDGFEVQDRAIPDDRLRLVFTCCHPAIAPATQVALTLRLVCGLTTAEVARAFLVSEPTMAARITRGKKKIAAARIPYRVPPAADLPGRVESALTVVHLLFTTGHTAPAGSTLVRRDLVERSLDLARMLHVLMPDEPEVGGLLALILLTDARRASRLDAEGQLILLADQDRTAWDRTAIAEGVALVRESLRRRRPGRFALMATIAAVHAEAPSWAETDWREIVALYDLLATRWASPVVALNRAVAIGFADGPEAGLGALAEFGDEPLLASYSYLASARAEFLRQVGRIAESRLAYQEALLLSENAVERAFLQGRLEGLGL